MEQEKEQSEAYRQGFQAATADRQTPDKERASNPYQPKASYEDWLDWDDGYGDAWNSQEEQGAS